MTDWKNIHSDFTSQLQKGWEERNFNYEQTKEWINIGLCPNEAEFAAFLSEQGYTTEDVLNNSDIDIESLREEYSDNNQKKFCCKHSRQANNLVTLAISQITGKSENDTGRRGGEYRRGVCLIYRC